MTPCDPDLEQDLAVGGALADGVVAFVRQVEVAVGTPVDAVGAGEDFLAPRAEETAVAVEHDHRVLAAVEDEDAVLVVDCDPGYVDQIPALGQIAPLTVVCAVRVLTRAEHHAHARPPRRVPDANPASTKIVPCTIRRRPCVGGLKITELHRYS